jgi:hypothetical protein
LTILVAPTPFIATATHPAEPTTPAARHLRRLSATVHSVAPTRRYPLDPQVTTEQWLFQRDDLAAEDVDRALARTSLNQTIFWGLTAVQRRHG